MPGLRTIVLALAGALLAGAVALATSTQADRPDRPKPKEPSREVRAMLGEMDKRNIRRSVETLAAFGTRNTLSAQDDPQRGIGAARDWIRGELEKAARRSDGRMTVALQSYVQEPASRIPRPTRITNVVATLRGTQAESAGRTYVVSGHYDSMCGSPTDAECDAPGANDDASGVAAVIEMARVMAKREFDATIVFMAVAGEEQGLYGSTHFAEQAKQAGMDIQGMFTNDIVGSSLGGNGFREPHAVRLFAEGVPTSETPAEAARRRSVGGENDSPSRQLARFAEEVAENRATGMDVRIIYRRDRYLRGGDQIPFLEQGYPAARFTEVNEDYDHQHQNVRVEDGELIGDLPQYVDYAYTTRVGRVNATTLAALADGPRAPRNARIITARLTNDTDLAWDANPEPDVAGYEVVWRETTEPRWTHVRRVGDVTAHTVERLSKDNFFFGVRAVDEEGNRSPVAFPIPASR